MAVTGAIETFGIFGKGYDQSNQASAAGCLGALTAGRSGARLQRSPR
jgi:hypothetical protein